MYPYQLHCAYCTTCNKLPERIFFYSSRDISFSTFCLLYTFAAEINGRNFGVLNFRPKSRNSVLKGNIKRFRRDRNAAGIFIAKVLYEFDFEIIEFAGR